MRKIVFISGLIAIAVFLTLCKKKEDAKEETKGYICKNGQCEIVNSDAKYLTLADCKSDCAPLPGKISFTTTGFVTGNYNATYTMAISVARSADDLDRGILVDSKVNSDSFFGGPPNYVTKSVNHVFETKELEPGIYYYSVTFSRKADSNPVSVQNKTDAVTVKAGATEQITAGF